VLSVIAALVEQASPCHGTDDRQKKSRLNSRLFLFSVSCAQQRQRIFSDQGKL